MLLISVGICLVMIATQYLEVNEASSTAEQFLALVCNGEIEQAEELAIGRAAWNLKQARNSANLASSTMVEANTKVEAWGRNWAQVVVCLEQRLVDGSYDVGWYDISLQRQRVWKVYSFASRKPPLGGAGLPLSNKELQEIKLMFQQYLRLISKGNYEGNYEEANKYLVGPARAAQEKTQAIMKGTPISYTSMDSTSKLWHKGRICLVSIKYRVDGREIEVIITAYRTREGWKIVEII